MHSLSKLLIGMVITGVFQASHHEWRLINNKHWQIVSGNAIQTQSQLSEACPAGMVHVKGWMKLDPDPNPWSGKTIEALQKTTCTNWINKQFPERCRSFDRNRWLEISKNFKTKPMDFCIDQFEYPNQKGQAPVIMVNFYEAQKLAEQQGKRLCSEEEWTFACEGEEAIPYGYGYERNQTCVIDKVFRVFNENKLYHRNDSVAMNELDHLWQGDVSGNHPQCKSAFEVEDMNFNIDEWTTAVRPTKYKSVLKGGAWTGVRNRCRPSTRNHSEFHTFYQQGFRTCTESKVAN